MMSRGRNLASLDTGMRATDVVPYERVDSLTRDSNAQQARANSMMQNYATSKDLIKG